MGIGHPSKLSALELFLVPQKEVTIVEQQYTDNTVMHTKKQSFFHLVWTRPWLFVVLLNIIE